MLTGILLAPPAVLAQTYPSKPVRILVGFLPGGGADVVARSVAQKLTEDLGHGVTVDNRAGAGGTIATAAAARAAPDGYTLLVISAAEPAQAALRAKLPYDLERDLAPISTIAIGAFMLVVHPSVPARSVKDVIALARAQPGRLNYASAGVGGTPHLAGEYFALLAKVKLVHVPYKGGSAAAVANASGEVALSFNSIPALLPLLSAGRLRPIAVTSARRSSSLPEVPTVSESGLPDYDLSGWFVLLAPAGTPREIVARLNAAVAKAVGTIEIRTSFARQGLDPHTGTPEAFAAFLRKEITRSAMLIKLTGAQPE
jgi:tripartite-type tricarboxylate transporter receptor subunit TctC